MVLVGTKVSLRQDGVTMIENKKKIITSILAAVVIIGLVALVMRGFSSKTEYTDNAYVQGDITAISAKVTGYVTEVSVEDNEAVKAGDVLFRIDDRDYQARLKQAQANVSANEAAMANAAASIKLQNATINQALAHLTSAEAVCKQAESEHTRQVNLYKSKVTTNQKLEAVISSKEQAQAAVASANANLEVQRVRLEVLAAQHEGAQASLAQAQAAYELAWLDLEHTVVKAPVDGIIGNRKVVLGRYVTPGASQLSIVPVNKVWVVANFKETQLAGLKSGQTVRISVDGYSNIVLKGMVDSQAPGSGAVFSLIPPDNATGNFIRTVQRVPVKIALTDNPLNDRLIPGLSVRVTVLIKE